MRLGMGMRGSGGGKRTPKQDGTVDQKVSCHSESLESSTDREVTEESMLAV